MLAIQRCCFTVHGARGASLWPHLCWERQQYRPVCMRGAMQTLKTRSPSSLLPPTPTPLQLDRGADGALINAAVKTVSLAPTLPTAAASSSTNPICCCEISQPLFTFTCCCAFRSPQKHPSQAQAKRHAVHPAPLPLLPHLLPLHNSKKAAAACYSGSSKQQQQQQQHHHHHPTS